MNMFSGRQVPVERMRSVSTMAVETNPKMLSRQGAVGRIKKQVDRLWQGHFFNTFAARQPHSLMTNWLQEGILQHFLMYKNILYTIFYL